MATLAVTNSFSSGTTIVASQMNTNFDDIESFINSSPGVLQLTGGTITGAVALTSTLTVGANEAGHDVKFFGDTTGHYLEWDADTDKLTIESGNGSTALDISDGNVVVGDGTLTVSGEIDGGSLDISGDADIDGTTNLDAVDIDGNVQLDGTLTIGVNDTGYDVKLFGATAGKYMEWDESEDQLDVTGSLDVTGNTSMVGTLTVGVDDTGHDVKFFGATAGSYMEWDESADSLIVANGEMQLGVGYGLKFDRSGTANHVLFKETASSTTYATGDDVVLRNPNASDIVFQTNGSNSRMVILSDGKVGINNIAPARLLQVTEGDSGVTPSAAHHVVIESDDDMGMLIAAGTTKNCYVRFGDSDSASAGGFNYDNNNNKLWIRVNASDRMSIDNSGLIRSARSYSATTGNAANLYVDTDGGFYRSTSSIRFKTDVETMEDSYADAVLGLRPVWYRSTAIPDRKDWSHWGLIAEEVEAIDPRLVYYGPEPELDSDGNDLYEEDADGISLPVYKKDSDGKVIETAQGVQYDRLVPHLLNLLKRQDARIALLEG